MKLLKLNFWVKHKIWMSQRKNQNRLPWVTLRSMEQPSYQRRQTTETDCFPGGCGPTGWLTSPWKIHPPCRSPLSPCHTRRNKTIFRCYTNGTNLCSPDRLLINTFRVISRNRSWSFIERANRRSVIRRRKLKYSAAQVCDRNTMNA